MAASLHSDHVNYLILRYLQEFGHEKAADAFLQDWNRPTEHHQPETFPFAPAVPRNELVSIIQNGLYLDELQARARKSERRYQWTDLTARGSAERHTSGITNGAGSRPPSQDKRRDRLSTNRRSGDFPTPEPKRIRRSEGSEAQVNGDAMDIDGDAVSGAEVDEDAGLVSPTNASEPEASASAERYDSLDVATQTEVKTGPKTITTTWSLDQPGASVLQSGWNPSAKSRYPRTLLAAGESLCRYYHIPDASADSEGEITHIDEPSRPPGSIVTAMTWRPDGNAAACVIDTISSAGNATSTQMVLEHSPNGHSISYQLGPPLLQPPGVILCLKYSASGKYLLAAHTSPNSENRGMVQIWTAASLDSEKPQIPYGPIAWRVFENQVLDAVWLNDDTFLVCGNHLSAVYRIEPAQSNGIAADAEVDFTNAAAMRGLTLVHAEVLDSKSGPLEKLCYDPQLDLVAYTSTPSSHEKKESSLHFQFGISKATGSETGVSKAEHQVLDLPSGAQVTALAIQPSPTPSEDADAMEVDHTRTLLAVAFDTGAFQLYSAATSPSPSAGSDSTTLCHKITSTLHLSNDNPALTFAWSPSGEFLAVGHSEVVQIWHRDAFRPRNGARHTAEALVTWRPPQTESLSQQAGENVNGNGAAPHVESEPSLSWSADGESLAFAADKQVAIIRFRPPLHLSASTSAASHPASPLVGAPLSAATDAAAVSNGPAAAAAATAPASTGEDTTATAPALPPTTNGVTA